MFKPLGRLLFGAAAAALVVTAAPREASAWFKVYNDTGVTVSVAHAFDSRNEQFCGYFDGCENGGVGNWRVKGWWNIDDGDTATVQTEDWNNATHEYFGIAGTLTWSGGGHQFRTSDAKFSYCGNTALGTLRTFKSLSTTRCCGVFCGGTVNFTLTLVL